MKWERGGIGSERILELVGARGGARGLVSKSVLAASKQRTDSFAAVGSSGSVLRSVCCSILAIEYAPWL